MLASWKHRAGTGWLGLALILPLLYLYQVVPHDHDVPEHAEPHSTPIHHANHSHADSEHSDHPADPPDQEHHQHHHHTLGQHLDFHLHRTLSQRPITPSGTALQVSSIILDGDSASSQARPGEPESFISDQTTISPFDPRGPPQQA